MALAVGLIGNASLGEDVARLEQIAGDLWPQAMEVLKKHAPELHRQYEVIDIAERILSQVRVEPALKEVSIDSIVSRGDQRTQQDLIEDLRAENARLLARNVELRRSDPVPGGLLLANGIRTDRVPEFAKIEVSPVDPADLVRQSAPNNPAHKGATKVAEKPARPTRPSSFQEVMSRAPVLPYEGIEAEKLVQSLRSYVDDPQGTTAEVLRKYHCLAPGTPMDQMVKWVSYHAGVFSGLRPVERQEYASELLAHMRKVLR